MNESEVNKIKSVCGEDWGVNKSACIRKLHAKTNYSQSQIAAIIGCKPQMVSNVIRGSKPKDLGIWGK